ncbi:MAG TPA: hypothetical protein PLH00_03245 [Bacteroidaceae bacterium]|jgi:hypothetical protein|nr:hypothetical protein [Bacteroidaceae bacterium]
MIEVKDRIPSKPNRVRIVPEGGGAPFLAVWERADQPIQEGTPVNKYLFDSIDEWNFPLTNLDDIEIDAQRVTLGVGWTTINFTRPLSGIPRVFVAPSDAFIISVMNITETSCLIAARQGVTASAYAAASSGGAVTTKITYMTGFDFVAAEVDVVAVYDGGVSV